MGLYLTLIRLVITIEIQNVMGNVLHEPLTGSAGVLLKFENLQENDATIISNAMQLNLSLAIISPPSSGDLVTDLEQGYREMHKIRRPVALMHLTSKPTSLIQSNTLLSMQLEKLHFHTKRDISQSSHKEDLFESEIAFTELVNNENDSIRDLAGTEKATMKNEQHRRFQNDDTFIVESIHHNENLRMCYRLQVITMLSKRLSLPLILLDDPTGCYVTHWQGFDKLHKTLNDSMVMRFGISQFLLGELLRDFLKENEEVWGGFAIIFDQFKSFQKFRRPLEALQKVSSIRTWTSNTNLNAQNLRGIQHCRTFLLDMSRSNLASFFELAAKFEILNSHTHFILTNEDSLNSLWKIISPLPSKVTLLRPQIPGLGFLEKRMSVTSQIQLYFIKNVAELLKEDESMQLLHAANKTPPSTDKKIPPSNDGQPKFAHRFLDKLKAIVAKSRGTFTDDIGLQQIGYAFDVLDIHKGHIRQFAEWDIKSGFKKQFHFQNLSIRMKSILRNRTLKVTTIEDPPFVIYRTTHEGKELHGNDRWTGFSMELLKRLSEVAEFQYEIHSVKDGRYGNLNDSTGKWDGMIGELIYGGADMAVSSLTITYDRERVIDFTTPYMSLSLSVIIKKTKAEVPLAQFMEPLSITVWLSILGTYVAISILFYIIGRITPFEWYQLHPCNPNIENQFGLLNSFWFAIGSLVQQGCDISPRATSTRIISTFWWMFILIVISSYTANLTAFLTIERLQTDIETIEDLARQTKMQYGTLRGGSTYSFFKNSDIPTYKQMWKFMYSNPDMFVNKTEHGIKRVLQEGYALILESTLNEYYVQRNCELMSLGGYLDPRGYGIGLPIGNTGLRDFLSEAILRLQKEQFIERLRQEWIHQYNVTVPCFMQTSASSQTSQNKLSMQKMAGAFIGLASGAIIALVVWFFEIGSWMWKIKKNQPEKFTSTMRSHLRRAFYGNDSEKETFQKANLNGEISCVDSGKATEQFDKVVSEGITF